MQWIGTLGYLSAAALWAGSYLPLTVAALILLAWMLVVHHFEDRLDPNDGPWNEPDALRLSFVILPTLSIGLSLFAPLYAVWALLF